MTKVYEKNGKRKNAMKTAMGIFCALALTLASAVGCGGNSGIDPNRAQLYVSSYEGGFGNDWLKAVAARFEEENAENSFLPGKTGVQIVIDGNKKSGQTLLANMDAYPQDLFFTERGYYYDGVFQGQYLDITDAVKEDLSEYGEEGSIFDKFNDAQKSYFEHDGKIYAVPHYASYFGLSYDIDLFERENLYFAREGGEGRFVQSAEQLRSLGPDGKTGKEGDIDYSADDGLPATYDEFFELCDHMLEKGITPLTYAGETRKVYLNSFLTALYADAEGEEQMALNYSFNGLADDLVNDFQVDASGKILSLSLAEPTEIGQSSGWKLIRQAGRAYALSFLDRLASDERYLHADAKNDACSHTEAQYGFLESSFTDAPIGFFIDGIYWENEAEASGSFAMLAEEYGERALRKNRRLGFLPLPKADDGHLGSTTLLDNLYSLAFINAKIDPAKIPLAKAFLRYCYTDRSLVEFTAMTNTPRSLRYEMPESELKKMTSFGSSVLSLKNKGDTAVVYPFDTDPLYLNHQSDFNLDKRWSAVIGGLSESCPIDRFRNGVSAAEYFAGMEEQYSASSWEALYGVHFQ